jgi:MEMO1 family protein
MSAGTVRRPAVAGTFYPDDPTVLAGVVDQNLADAAAPTGPAPKALIAPHAGYIYSGPVAGTAYRRLETRAGLVTRVVLLGPAHRVPLEHMAVPTVDAFETPLGLVPIDADARRRALELPTVRADDLPHEAEHSLEVHLPFLQRTLGVDGWSLLPVVVGGATPDEVAELLDEVWGGDETLVVASTDLSHYHDYETARTRDRVTAEAITSRSTDALGPYDACGVRPVQGLVEAVRRRDLTVELVDLRNSGDTAGPRDRVVGYGAFVVS